MAENFTAMTEQQMEWMRRVVRHMIELTAYYEGMEQPLKEEEYEHIMGVFSGYTQKSRNNMFIIRSSVIFAEYLNEIAKKKPAYACLKRGEMQRVISITENLFEMTIRSQGFLRMEGQLTAVGKQMDECIGELGKHRLVQNLTEMFKNYLSACMKENIQRDGKNNHLQTLPADICRQRAKSR